MALDNDTRGWIMTVVSALACILGASIICVDLIVRRLPFGKKDFAIENSNAFLSSSLSLSFGVMIFSALYNMLPSAKSELRDGGFSPKAAAWTLIACFLAGAVGIQILSNILHHYIPHSVVDCDHSHDEEEGGEEMEEDSHKVNGTSTLPTHHDHSENGHHLNHGYGGTLQEHNTNLVRRPSLPSQISARISQLVTKPQKKLCDEHGQCYGYSDPCGQECFKIVQARGGTRVPAPTRPSGLRTVTLPAERQPLLQQVDEESPLAHVRSAPFHTDSPASTNGSPPAPLRTQPSSHSLSASSTTSIGSETGPTHQHMQNSSHHHHVPTNAFLSLGLQTSIAIALHKIPEGFILFSTNHASPRLGISVFMALFIHNFTEGFSLSLPLYLAMKSRTRALIWSSLLGGASQPLGAGIAALVFHFAGKKGDDGPGQAVYGAMFAVTAGIMASVACQLFGESLELTHSRQLCFAFGFVGMGILGMSSALTA